MLALALMDHCHCSHVKLLSIIAMCIVMSEIIGPDTTQYVTTQINCRFQLFFKLNIITCPVYSMDGMKLAIPIPGRIVFCLQHFILFLHMLCGIAAAGINETMNRSFFLLLLDNFNLCYMVF